MKEKIEQKKQIEFSEKIDESVDAIDQGDNNRAYKIYKSTVLKLKNDWLKDKELKDG